MTITKFPTSSGEIEIGDGLPAYLIAEIGLNHNGSEELARDMIRSAAQSGASFVKLQKRSPAHLASASFLDAPFLKCPLLGTTQRQVRERLELPLDTYIRLRKYSESLGLVFFASAFDLESVDFLIESGTKIIKIASHSLTNGPLLKRIAELKLPAIASLGGCTLSEQDRAIEILQGCPLIIMHCVSSYPTPDGLARLDTITYLRERYGLPVGYSSHEVGIDLSVASSMLGACMIERHFTLDRAMIGLDQPISLEPREFAEMATKVRRLFGARGIRKTLANAENVAKHAYHVAIRASVPIKTGQVIEESMISCKQPLSDPSIFFTGLETELVIGKTCNIDIDVDEAIPREAIVA
jgi:sialic acid synthase SpsE